MMRLEMRPMQPVCAFRRTNCFPRKRGPRPPTRRTLELPLTIYRPRRIGLLSVRCADMCFEGAPMTLGEGGRGLGSHCRPPMALIGTYSETSLLLVEVTYPHVS